MWLFCFLIYVPLLVRNHVEPLTYSCFPPVPVKHSQTSCFPPSQDVHFSEVPLKPKIPLKKRRNPCQNPRHDGTVLARDFSEEIIKFSSTPEELAPQESLLLHRTVGIYPGIGLQQQEWSSAQSEYCNQPTPEWSLLSDNLKDTVSGGVTGILLFLERN